MIYYKLNIVDLKCTVFLHYNNIMFNMESLYTIQNQMQQIYKINKQY